MPDSNDNIPSSSRRKSLIDMPGLWRPILFVLIPLFLEQVSILVYYASDQYLLGHFFETPHIAAYGTMGYLMGLFFGIGSLASIGSAVMVARFAGAKDDSQLNKVLNQSLTLAIFFGIVLFVYWSVNAENTFRMLGLKDDTLVFAVQYMRIFRWSFPFFILYYVGLANFHGSGNMIVGLCITFAKNFITIVISWGCVTGFGIFPTFGWWGMNFAITCGYCFDGIAVLIILRHGIYGRRLIFREMIPQWSMIRRILAIGIPGGLTVLVTIFAEIWFITQINGLGQLSAAAHEICFRIQTLAYNPVYAFSLVAMTLVGQYLGAGLLPRTKRTVLTVYCVTIVYLLSIGIIFYL